MTVPLPSTATTSAATAPSLSPPLPSPDGGLATTGLHVDVALLCVIAALLIAAGVFVAVRSRGKRSQEGRRRLLSRGKPTAVVLGLILLLGVAAPAPEAHAMTTPECNAVQVSLVSIDPAPSSSGSLTILPGEAPVVITARVTNVTSVPVSLFALSSTDPSAPLAGQVVWTAQRAGFAVSSVLTDTDPHSLGSLAAGETADVTFTIGLPASVGNEYQGQSASASLFVRVVQSSP